MDFKNYIGEKKLSVGLILTDGAVFLAVNPTGHRIYDIPKGEVEPGDGLKQTLIREMEEELSVNISKWSNKLIDMGQFEYMIHKDVHVFVLILDDLPPASNMKCTSMFMLNGRPTPEVIRHRYVSFDNLEIFNPYMENIIKKIYNRIKDEV